MTCSVRWAWNKREQIRWDGVAEGEMCVDVLEFPVVCASTGGVDETPGDVEMRS